MFTICYASAAWLSESPGVSMIRVGASSPSRLPVEEFVLYVQALIDALVLNNSMSRHLLPRRKLLQSELLPVPVFPITQSVVVLLYIYIWFISICFEKSFQKNWLK